VTERLVNLGDHVTLNQPLFRIVDFDSIVARIYVPEQQLRSLALEQQARLRSDSLAVPFRGEIDRIAPVVDPETGTVKVTVAVERSVVLRPGAFAQIAVVTDVHPDALVVPRSALVAEGRRWLVFRANEEGSTVAALEVERGFEEGERVEIAATLRGEPLRAGDRVVSLGAAALSDGARIRIREHSDAERETTAADARTRRGEVE
jgi:membrane fusion protein (multidrug efflux system)